jgi:hypothetical protein
MTTRTEQETAQPAPPKRRTGLVAAAAALLLAVAGGGLYVALTNTDSARIRGVVTDFAAAVHRQDYPMMLDLLCAEEAAGITEDDDYDPAAGPIDADVPELDVTDVQVAPDGQSATALLTMPGREAITIHLRQERDRWTVCAPS